MMAGDEQIVDRSGWRTHIEKVGSEFIKEMLLIKAGKIWVNRFGIYWSSIFSKLQSNQIKVGLVDGNEDMNKSLIVLVISGTTFENVTTISTRSSAKLEEIYFITKLEMPIES